MSMSEERCADTHSEMLVHDLTSLEICVVEMDHT